MHIQCTFDKRYFFNLEESWHIKEITLLQKTPVSKGDSRRRGHCLDQLQMNDLYTVGDEIILNMIIY